VALRPHDLAPLQVQDEIYSLFGGERGQWVVLAIDADPEQAVARGDRLAEALDRLVSEKVVSSFDALTSFGPAPDTQRMRLQERDALDLPSLAPRLEAALSAAGFDLTACAPALDAFRHPSHQIMPLVDPNGELGWIVARHRAEETIGKKETIVALYVRPHTDEASIQRARTALRAADPHMVITGYTHLEAALKRTLSHDLPIVALVALVLVAITLRAALGRVRDVVLAIVTVVVELAIVAGLMRLFQLRWHVYDALVLPVLIGITIDEAMFLLHAARDAKGNQDPIAHTIEAQGPLVASTALTTAAGFAALMACRFDGLHDLGAVGAVGSVAGLLCALLLVPSGLRASRSQLP
jgi:predicted exporter